MEPKLIKIDRNGSKHFEGMIKCDRCGGHGIYAIGVHNGQLVPAHPDAGVCYKCNGKGMVLGKWIERTPEYQAKLDAKRQAKWDAEQAKWDAEQARLDEERLAREAKEAEEKAAEEARIKAQKAISQYVGSVGERLEIKCTYQFSGSWEQKSFSGFGTTTMYCHTFKDPEGNVFTWKTQNGIGMNYGEPVILKGTVKEHSEYKDEKQTQLTRCKIQGIA